MAGFLDFEMERGAHGAMTGYCFAELLVDGVALSRAGARAARVGNDIVENDWMKLGTDSRDPAVSFPTAEGRAGTQLAGPKRTKRGSRPRFARRE
jgi:hypothetical protein